MLENGFKREKNDNTLFLKAKGRNLFIVQVYVDDIIFRATTSFLYDEFAKLISSEFEISMIGELNLFLGLQIMQSATRTTVCQQKYIHELLKRFHMEDTKPVNAPIGTFLKLDLDEPGPSVNETMY